MGKLHASVVTLIVLLLSIGSQAAEFEFVISAGKQGGGYYGIATRLEKVLKEQGATLGVQESVGSLQNLQRLDADDSPVNLAITQADALKLYLNKNPGFLDKFEILESVGKECVFVIAGKDSGLLSHEDMQKEGDKHIAILSPDSGVAVTYELMSTLAPKFRNTQVRYMDTMEAMWQIGSGQDNLHAVMLVQRPKVRSPEMQLALRHPEDYRFVPIDDKDLEDRLPDGTAVYEFLDLALVQQGSAGQVTVKTICTEGLLVGAKDKIPAPQRSQLKDVLARHWMLIYPTTQ